MDDFIALILAIQSVIFLAQLLVILWSVLMSNDAAEESKITFKDVFADELKDHSPECTKSQQGLFKKCSCPTRMDRDNLCGLAFSGGGIRSATFNLGIIQALANKGLLDKFDYLSTVSGGGYIGSWLTSWACRNAYLFHSSEFNISNVAPLYSTVTTNYPLTNCPSLTNNNPNDNDKIEWLNKVLSREELFEKIANTANTTNSQKITDLKEEKGKLKRALTNLDIIKFNRLALELVHPNETPKHQQGINKVQDILGKNASVNTHSAEPEEVAWLRRYSNYLTPRKGLFSLDTLTGVTYHIRNVFLSSLTVGLFMFGLLTLIASGILAVPPYFALSIPTNNYIFWAGLFAGFIAIAYTWYNLPTILSPTIGLQPIQRISEYLPVTIAVCTVLFSIIWGIEGNKLEPIMAGALLGGGYFVISALAMILALARLINAKLRQLWLISSALIGSISLFFLGYFTKEISKFLIVNPNDPTPWEQFGITAPLTCLLVSLAIAIHLGIVGRLIHSEAYFWISRIAGRMVQFSIFFALPAIAFLIFPTFFDWSESMLSTGGLGVIYLITARWLAASSDTGGANSKKNSKIKMASELFASAAPFVLILLLVGFAAEGVRDMFGNDKLPWGNQLFADYRFTANELKSLYKEPDSLCRFLMEKELSENCNPDPVSGLNHLLMQDDFYKKVRAKLQKKDLLAKGAQLEELEKKYRESEKEHDLINFNRAALEKLYPNEAPEHKAKQIWLNLQLTDNRFTTNEFKDAFKNKSDSLCDKIKTELESDCNPDPVSGLNRLLIQDDFYKKVREKLQENELLEKDAQLEELEKKYRESEKEHDLINFNRAALEKLYPNETPEHKAKQIWFNLQFTDNKFSTSEFKGVFKNKSDSLCDKIKKELKSDCNPDPVSGLNHLLTQEGFYIKVKSKLEEKTFQDDHLKELKKQLNKLEKKYSEDPNVETLIKLNRIFLEYHYYQDMPHLSPRNRKSINYYNYIFTADEFNGLKNKSDDLCNKLKAELYCNPDPIQGLNHLLTQDDVSTRFKSKLEERTTQHKKLKLLEEKYIESQNEYDLIKLNRIALENLYSQETPRRQFDYDNSLYSCQNKVILSENRAEELKRKGIHEESALQGESNEIATNCTPGIKAYYEQNLAILGTIEEYEFPYLSASGKQALFIISLVVLALATFLARLINANLFSLHCYYRNRLTNAYLGASNQRVKRDKNIGIHSDDALRLHDLTGTKPYLLINTAVNLVGAGNDLAWQDRMAASFVMSPKYCGYALNADGQYFQETEEFGKGNWHRNDDPIKINLAMTISGAAGSPMGGFHTKPGVSMLLALTGVRLGWWLKNPAIHKAWKGNAGSGTSLLSAFPREMFGFANKDSKVVYLSDGGHFENLGIYELVRRRCKVIVASDAGADPDYVFDDLANAIHKIRVDFGVEIEIDISHLRPQAMQSEGDDKLCINQKFCVSEQNYVVGRIKYHTSPLKEFQEATNRIGTLIYIKSSIPKSIQKEAIDVLYYATTHKVFPHEPTSDQWFSEEQFEAYRKVGFLIGEGVAKDIQNAIKGA